MTKVGKEISVEPVVGIDEPWVLTDEDLPVILMSMINWLVLTCKEDVKAIRLTSSISTLL